MFKCISFSISKFSHEPAKGIIKSPKQFVGGIAKGTQSLVKNSVFGIFNTASKITGLKKQRKRKKRERQRDFIYYFEQ